MEFLGLVDADLNLARADAVNHTFNTGEERVAGLPLNFDRSVESGSNRIGGGAAGLAADEQPDTVDFLPGAVEREKRADLEVSGGNVDRLAQVAPLTNVLERLPVLAGVVDDEAVWGRHVCVSLVLSPGVPETTRRSSLSLRALRRRHRRQPGHRHTSSPEASRRPRAPERMASCGVLPSQGR